MQFKIKTGRIQMPWWINPSLFLLAFILPMFLVISAALLGFRGSPTIAYQYSAPVYAELSDIVIILIAILALAAGTAVAGGLGRAIVAPPRSRFVVSEAGLYALFALTLFAYVLWFGPTLITNPALIIGALVGNPGASYAVRVRIDTIPGLTTLTQFGVSYILVISGLIGMGAQVRARFIAFAAVIIILAVLRAAIWSERIAVIELVFPLFAIAAARLSLPSYTKPAITLGPYLGAVLMPFVFIAFEINRSWASTYSQIYNSIVQFTVDRVSIYYTSALNNGIGYLKYSENPTFTGEYTFNWLYSMPFVGAVLRGMTGADAQTEYTLFLKRSADAEFNNYTGIALIPHDWGWMISIFFFFLYGLIVGLAYKSFKQNRGMLGLMFPLFLYALYEILRIGYVNEARFFTAFVGVWLYWVIGSFNGVRSAPTINPRRFQASW